MNLLQKAFQCLILAVAPLKVGVDGENVFDVLVIHDDDAFHDIHKVVKNDINFGLIHRIQWEAVEATALRGSKDIAAFDDPALAQTLLELLRTKEGGDIGQEETDKLAP